jgi:hypothetical protein
VELILAHHETFHEEKYSLQWVLQLLTARIN